MSNWVDVQLDVLASSPEEINRIEKALQNPCGELTVWQAQRTGEQSGEIAAWLQETVTFQPVANLGYLDPSVNKARRFRNSWKDRFGGLAWSHVHLVSRDFPIAVFLAQYWDDQMSYGGKKVIRDGEEVRHSRDRHHRAQACEWVLPNIFAPFEAEHDRGLEFGTLWNEWIEEMEKEVAELRKKR